MKFSEKAFVNRTAIIAHTIIDSILILAYTIELLKGSRTIGYFSFFTFLCIAPIVVEFTLFSKEKESYAIKHVICIGYSILYLFAIFTTTSTLACTYAFPMFMVIILFMDVKCSGIIAAGAFLGKIYHAVTVGYTTKEMPDVEIRVICVALTGIYMILVCTAVKKVNEEKLKRIQEQTEEAKTITSSILETSDKMILTINDVTEKVDNMGESMELIQNSIGEVSSGSAETAESVQIQLEQTEKIQTHITNVKNAAAQIEQNMKETAHKVEKGKMQMGTLAKQMNTSMSANKQVLDQMNVLNEYYY